MRRFGSAFMLQLRRLVRQGAIPACLFILVLFTLLLGVFLPPGSEEGTLRVGVYIPPGSEKGAAIWRVVQAYADEQTVFIAAQSGDEVEQMVAARIWECGYVFDEQLDERLASGQHKRLITRVVSPASMPLFSGWMLSAAILEVCAPDIAADVLNNHGVPVDGEAVEALTALYFTDRDVMEIEVHQMQGDAAQPGGTAMAMGPMLARGLLALLLFLVCCLAAVRHARDMASGFFMRLGPYTHPAGLFFPAYAAVGLLCAVAGGACLALGALFYGTAYGPWWYEAALLLLYLIYLGTFSFFLAAVFRRGGGLVALLPFLLIACLLLSPVFFDIGALLPTLRPLTMLLPPTLYLRGAAGATAALWQLPAGAAVLFILGLAVHLLRRRRHGRG